MSLVCPRGHETRTRNFCSICGAELKESQFGPGRSTGSPMAQMSKAIRLELEKHGSTLRDVPAEILRDFITIVSAFRSDMIEEYERRDG